MTPVRGPYRRRPERTAYDREKCRVCGYLRINVRHEQDPEHAPEGAAYYRANVPDLHEFAPSGTYEQ